MTTNESRLPFRPKAADTAGVISWIHIGDLHMTKALEQNHLDLRAIVEEINAVFTGSTCFAFLRGDVAYDGSGAAGVDSGGVKDGVYSIRLVVEDVMGQTAEDTLCFVIGERADEPERRGRDQDNALPAWPEHGLLGTQPGPNKNGKKW